MHTDEVKYHIYSASPQDEAVEAVTEQLTMLVGYFETGAIRSLE